MNQIIDKTGETVVEAAKELFKPVTKTPGGVLPYQDVGGGGAWTWHRVRGRIWGKVQSSSPNKRKNLGSSVTTRRKNWERIAILGTFGVISEIQRAKFEVSVTYIFGGKIWGSDMNFRGTKTKPQNKD